MDAFEATKVVLSRIQSLDPENAHKIMGLLLLQEHGEQEIIRLAFGPETLLQSVVFKAKKELGLVPPPASPFLLRQSSASRLLAASSPPSWAPPSVFSRSNSGGSNGFSASLDELPNSDELVSPGNVTVSPYCGGGDGGLIDEYHLPDQLSFLDDLAAAPSSNKSGSGDVLRPDIECRSPSGDGDGALFPIPSGMSWGLNDGYHHRRSSSAVDLCLGDPAAGFGWKPCLYYARGFCKNGTGCRFLHGLPDEAAAVAAGAKMDAAVEQHCHELLLRSKSQRITGASQLMASAFPYSPTGSVPLSPSSSSSKCLSSWLLQQQQQKHNESQRAAAAAAAALDEIHKLMGRSRMERSDLMVNPAARQIYLTFPAVSTFSEEDVSNYFSIYGLVQDVRIPYQQKRMFGFVTFVYPETVKVILAKGNPHFVCDSRVLVKPYKEKGKVPDKFRKQQQQSESYDLQHLGARMLYNNGIANHDLLLRRKLEEQQQAAELQRAIELQGRRFMGLQLLDLNNRSLSSSAPASINSPAAAAAAARSISTTDSSNSSSREEDSPKEDTDPSLEHQNCKVRDSPPSMEAPLTDHEPSFSFPFPTFA